MRRREFITQKLRVLLQRRDTPTPRLGGAAASLAKALNPNHRCAAAHILMVCRLTPRCAALRPRYHLASACPRNRPPNLCF